MSGQWGGVSIAPESFDNELTCVNMRSSSDGLSVDSCGNTSRRKLLIANSWLHNSQASALKVSHARVEAYGSCFSEAALNVVDLRGGVYDFTQCTFSNYYLFSAPTEPIVGLYDIKATDDNPTATMQAEFKNCIIYGLSSDLNVGDFTDTAIYLRNTLLHSEGTDDDHFIECIWNADPLFYTIREDYYFNYRLKPDSPAIGAGNPAFVTGGCAYDMDGIYRLSSARPDLGAYCFVAPTE
jgi:hypothetical protein